MINRKVGGYGRFSFFYYMCLVGRMEKLGDGKLSYLAEKKNERFKMKLV